MTPYDLANSYLSFSNKEELEARARAWFALDPTVRSLIESSLALQQVRLLAGVRADLAAQREQLAALTSESQQLVALFAELNAEEEVPEEQEADAPPSSEPHELDQYLVVE